MKRDFKFVKYHGCGNDFILRDEVEVRPTPDRIRSRMAKDLTDRNFSVGADGVIFIERAKGVDASMRLFEPAGNEADMCGNGIRCVAAYLMTKLGKDSVDIQTRDGVKRIEKVGGEYRVDMGVVRTRRKDLRAYVMDKGKGADLMLGFKFRAGDREFSGSIVNSGEPHIVARARNIGSMDMKSIGDAVNKDRRRFPGGVNVNFVQVKDPHTILVRTYERGVYDETLACGTGSTAAAVVALLLKWVRPGTVNVITRGGRIRIQKGRGGRAFMTGPAIRAYEGQLCIDA